MNKLLNLETFGYLALYLEHLNLLLLAILMVFLIFAFVGFKGRKPSFKLLASVILSTILSIIISTWVSYEHTQLSREKIRNLLSSNDVAVVSNVGISYSEEINEIVKKATYDTSVNNQSARKNVRLYLNFKLGNKGILSINAYYQEKSKWSLYSSEKISPYYKGEYFIGNVNDKEGNLYKVYCSINTCDDAKIGISVKH